MLLVLPAVLMQFMGDQPKPRGQDEMELLYTLLKVSSSCVCWKPGGDTGSPEDESLSWEGTPAFHGHCSLASPTSVY